MSVLLKAQAETEKKKEDSHNAPPAPVYIPPLPRHSIFPSVTYGKVPSVSGDSELNFSEKRFWIIIILASWNPKSSEITDILNKNFKQFEKRNVGVIGLFSNDTTESVEIWRKKNKPLFLNAFASRNLLDDLKNPKVPTVWVIGNEGEKLQYLELPTTQKFLECVAKVMVLTEF